MRILVVGEILWDVFENGEHLGGAPFNFCTHATRLGHTVFFVSAVGTDDRGYRALERVAQLGLSTRFIRRVPDYPTGVVDVSVDSTGEPRFTIYRPAAYDFPIATQEDFQWLASQKPEWIYFGTVQQVSQQARALTRKLIQITPGAQGFYDVNLRAGCYEPTLVNELLELANVVKMNQEETQLIRPMFSQHSVTLEDFCRTSASQYVWEGVCVTRGEEGCALLINGEYVEVPGYAVDVVDTVGAGDAFAAAFLHGLHSGLPPREIADFANRVGALVASREGGTPDWSIEEARAFHSKLRAL